MNPVLYDFRRAFVRPATLIALLAFILVGVGLSYLVSATLSVSMQYISPQALGILDVESGRLRLFAYVVDAELRPVNARIDVELKLVNKTGLTDPASGAVSLKNASYEARGFLNATIILDENESAVLKQLLGESGMFPYLVFTASSPVGSRSQGGAFVNPGKDSRIQYWCPVCSFLSSEDYSKVIASSTMVYRVNDEFVIIAILDLPGDGFKLYYALSPNVAPGFEGYVLAGSVSSGVNIFRVRAGNVSASEARIAYVALEGGDGTLYFSEGYPVARAYAGRVQRALTSQLVGSAGLGLFSSFFPIVVLYLVYALIAKPKGIGALEFLIARPVSRWDVYATRFAAGVLTATASSAVFMASVNAASLLLIGYTMELGDALTVFLGLTGSLIAFYSLCYMLSTFLSGGRYLAVSIFAYLFFTMILNVLVAIIAIFAYGFGPGLASRLSELQYTVSYFNPLGMVSFATYFVYKGLQLEGFTEVAVVDPYLVVLAGAAWILVPFIIGWFVFKRAILSR
ncbi:MAG: ABC transporter permease subunit [Thermosphaera sp.]